MKELAGSLHQLGTSLHQFQAKTDGAITDLTKQMSQLATSMSALTNEPRRLPSQTIQNPKENINAVTLRSGQRSVAEPTEPEEDETQRYPKKNESGPRLSVLADQTYPKEADRAQNLGPRIPNLAPLFPSQCQSEFPNNMSWTKMCSSCSAESRSTSLSWNASGKSRNMQSS
ncbi:unnamed protein product [Rhodiola kirilowii]